MKKRLISMLLVAVLAVSLLAGYSLSANAETVSYSTMTYRMQSGDYVLRICQRLGLNYYTCKTAIMKLNNITDNQWNKLAVGRLLTLPSTDADAIVVATGHGSTMNSSTNTSTSSSTASSSTAAATPKATTTKTQSSIDNAISKDTCWWYMVPYKLSMGETVTDACNALGISYSRWKKTIERDNNITNWNSIPAGTTLWLPTVSEPAKGTQCYTVYRHIMGSGETVYGVVSDRGLDYNALKPMLQTINDGRNLASYKEGEAFFYPVATTIALPSDTTSNNKTITTNSDGTTTIVQTYKLTSNIDTGAAVVEFYVNGKQVKEAKAGDTVNVSITTKGGRAAKNVRVKFANGQADLLLTSFSFTMPSCDIAIDADVSKGHNIEIVCNYIGKAVTLVDGVSMNAAATGAAVTVASNDPALVPTQVYVSYKTLTGTKREALTNIDQGFVMPDADVTVEVTLEAVPTYPIYVIDNANNNFGANGSFTLQVNGNDVTRAAKGAEVSIKAKPNDGYTIGGIVVQRHSTGQNVNAFNNTFTMPADAVDVQVVFQPKDNNTILINPVQGGQFYATDQNHGADPNPSTIALRNQWAVQEAQTNTRVYLNWVPETAGDNASYVMETRPAFADSYVVTNSKGLRVPVTIDGTGVWFRMPAGGATVTGAVRSGQRIFTGSVILDGNNVNQYQDISLYLQTDSEKTGNQPRHEYQTTNQGAAPQFQANVGEYVNVSYNVDSKNIALDRYEVWVAGARVADLTGEIMKNGCLQMPALQAPYNDPTTVFEIRAYFVSNVVKLASADVKITGVGAVGMATGPDGDGNYTSVNGVRAGENFSITLAPANGYTFNFDPNNPSAKIRVLRKDTGGEIAAIAGPIADPNGNGTLLFDFGPMPADGVKVEVVFDKLAYQLNITTLDEDGDPLTGGSFVKITRNNADTVVENWQTTMNVEYGDTIAVGLTDTGNSQYTFVSTEVNGFVSKNTSFKVSGDIANNPVINLIVNLKSKTLTQTNNPIKLNAASTNEARGNVKCIIQASPSGLSVINNQYTDVAYSQDTVAIFPLAGVGYYTDADHVHVYVDNGEQKVTETTINGQTAYTYTMPSSGYKNIRVEFLPIEYNLTIKVLDSKSPNPEVANLIKASYSSGGTDPDVLFSNSYRPVPYGSTVYVNLSEYAKSQGVTMDQKGDTNPPVVAPGTLPVPDKNKANVAATLENSGNGVKFTMPAGDCTLTVYMNNVPAEPPAPAPVVLPKATTESGINVIYYKADGTTPITDYTAMSGETVIAKLDTALPAGKTLKDGIHLLDSSSKDVVVVEDGGSFTVSSDIDGSKAAKITLIDKQYTVRVRVVGAPAEANVTVTANGNTVPVSDGMTIFPNQAYYAPLSFTTDKGNITSVSNLNVTSTLPAATAAGNLKPDASVADGATVDVTVNFQKTYKLKVNLVNAEAGDSVVVGTTTITKSGDIVDYDYLAGDGFSFSAATKKIKEVAGTDFQNITINTDQVSGSGNLPAAPASDTLTLTITFMKPECTLKKTDSDGIAVTYYHPDDSVCNWASVEQGYTVKVEASPVDDAYYVKSMTIEDVDGNKTKISNGGEYTVNAAIKQIVVEREKKVVKVKLIIDDDTSASGMCRISTDQTNWVTAQLNNLNSGDRVYVKAYDADISAFSFKPTDAFGNPTTFSRTGGASDTKNLDGTIKLPATVKNGDTIEIHVTLVPEP